MQLKPKHLLTMLVMAGISAFAGSADAATFVQGDVLLSFRASSGSNTVLTINLGQASQFRNAQTNGTNLTNFLNIGSALTATYGNAWQTGDSTLFWAVAGINNSSAVGGDPTRTTYLSVAQDTLGVGQHSTAWGDPTALGSTARGNLNTQISSAQTSFISGTESSPGIVALANTTTTWDENVVSGFGAGSTAEGSFASGATGTALDLYRILNTATGANPSGTAGVGTWEGTFTISNTGSLSFITTSAVPEPSRVLLGGLGLAGLVLRRRRSLKA